MIESPATMDFVVYGSYGFAVFTGYSVEVTHIGTHPSRAYLRHATKAPGGAPSKERHNTFVSIATL
jgi:hypothetical protein